MSGLRSAFHVLSFFALVAFLLTGVTACDQSGDGLGTVLGQQVDGGTSGNSATVTGNVLPAATKVVMDTDDTAVFSGSIPSGSSVAVFDIGPIARGDRIEIDMSHAGGLDSAVGLFDDEENLIAINDNRYGGVGGDQPLLHVISRRSTPRALVVVTSSPRKSSSGTFSAALTIDRNFTDVDDRPQVFVFEFDGATGANAGGRGPMNIPSFNAADIDSRYSGRTDQMIDSILRFVRDDFAALNVEFYRSGDPAIPDGDTTSVYFGLDDPALLGLADYVDVQNANPKQAAIVYTDTFALFLPFNPSVDQMAQTIANVASHEAGHLLGLNHTEDPLGIMDTTASAFELMQDQTFRRSPLDRNVYRAGQQSGFPLLLETVGSVPSTRLLAASLIPPPPPVMPLDPDHPLMHVSLPKCDGYGGVSYEGDE